MKLEGSRLMPGPRPAVWRVLLDPDVLVRAIPGCEKLEPVGEGLYKAVFKAGVGNIKGTFQGEVRIADIVPEKAYTLASRAKAAVGWVEGKGRIELEDDPAGTLVRYSGEVKTGGMLAAVGGRLAEAAARKNLEDLFANLEREVTAARG